MGGDRRRPEPATADAEIENVAAFARLYGVVARRTNRDAPVTTADMRVSLDQSVSALALRGGVVRLRARVRVTDPEARGAAGLWLRVDRDGGGRGFFDGMADRPIRDHEWTEYPAGGAVTSVGSTSRRSAGTDSVMPPLRVPAAAAAVAWLTKASRHSPPDLATPVEPDRDGASAGILCPLCHWRPSASSLWGCAGPDPGAPAFFGCGTVWHTFSTRGRCPGCGHRWQWTRCLACEGWSPHDDWYVAGRRTDPR